ncbi:hypothetical protein FQA39_LY09505 [Lamprigera yunnana]|nr:hypothetical protein FQA39_LY09505 [Lamprigera yunnana]
MDERGVGRQRGSGGDNDGLSSAELQKLANEFSADISDELQSESEDLLLEDSEVDSADLGNHSSDDSVSEPSDNENINTTVTKDGTFRSKAKPSVTRRTT